MKTLLKKEKPCCVELRIAQNFFAVQSQASVQHATEQPASVQGNQPGGRIG